MEINNSNDAWLNRIRSFAECEIEKIALSESLDEMEMFCRSAECYMALLVDLRSWRKLDRYADEADEILTELEAKKRQAVGTHRDLIIANINEVASSLSRIKK